MILPDKQTEVSDIHTIIHWTMVCLQLYLLVNKPLYRTYTGICLKYPGAPTGKDQGAPIISVLA